jgi:hypothetical protein
VTKWPQRRVPVEPIPVRLCDAAEWPSLAIWVREVAAWLREDPDRRLPFDPLAIIRESARVKLEGRS